MKNVITILALVASLLGFGQSESLKGKAKETSKVESVSIAVTVDSVEELESTFKTEDIKKMIEATNENETYSFTITCNGEVMSNGEKSKVTYSVEGNSNQPEKFLRSVEVIRTTAINHYKN